MSEKDIKDNKEETIKEQDVKEENMKKESKDKKHIFTYKNFIIVTVVVIVGANLGIWAKERIVEYRLAMLARNNLLCAAAFDIDGWFEYSESGMKINEFGLDRQYDSTGVTDAPVKINKYTLSRRILIYNCFIADKESDKIQYSEVNTIEDLYWDFFDTSKYSKELRNYQEKLIQCAYHPEILRTVDVSEYILEIVKGGRIDNGEFIRAEVDEDFLSDVEITLDMYQEACEYFEENIEYFKNVE